MTNFNQYNILYVEDEDKIRENYASYFQRFFKNVYLAADAESGLELYKQHKPELLVVDISLPKMDGLSLTAKIREVDQSVKVIVLTAHSDTPRLLQATELKLTKYLIKPITRKELLEALELAVDELSSYEVIATKKLHLQNGLVWDRTKNELIGGESLTKNEKKLMEILTMHPNKVYDYDDIILEIWWGSEEDKRGSLKTLVKNIRKKLPVNTIENIYGQGYRLNL